MEDQRPFAANYSRGSSESIDVELEDELRCLYASARSLTGYLMKQREDALRISGSKTLGTVH
jgi:hypothetical protein